MPMRVWTVLLSLAAIASPAVGQYIEFSFDAPSDNISGLAYLTSENRLYALDSLECVLLELDAYDGTVYDTIPIVPAPDSPVALTGREDTLWFAESGTGVVHEIDLGGTELASYDLSDSGVQSITGLARQLWGDDTYVMDESDNTIYLIDGQIGSVMPEVYMQLEGCPQVHGISGMMESWWIGVACEDPVSPVRLYHDPPSYEPLGMGEYESAVAMASYDGSRFYFSDPDMGMIHRYCCNMGGTAAPVSAGLGQVRLAPADNPAHGSLGVRLSVRHGTSPEIAVLDVAGRMIDRVPGGALGPGSHTVEFDGLRPGVYYVLCGDSAAPLKAVVLAE